jgi:predicted nucleic acid-binding protein
VTNSRGVVTTTDLASGGPARVLVDTTLMVEAMVADQDGHRHAAELLAAVEATGADVVFSRLLEIEAPQAMAHIAGRRATGDRRAGLRDGRVRRRSRRMALEVRAGWHEFLDRCRWQRVEIDAVAEDVPEVMFRIGLSSYDAVHAASAIAAECDAIATLDTDFGRIPTTLVPTIITTPARVARMRRRRTREILA